MKCDSVHVTLILIGDKGRGLWHLKHRHYYMYLSGFANFLDNFKEFFHVQLTYRCTLYN